MRSFFGKVGFDRAGQMNHSPPHLRVGLPGILPQKLRLLVKGCERVSGQLDDAKKNVGLRSWRTRRTTNILEGGLLLLHSIKQKTNMEIQQMEVELTGSGGTSKPGAAKMTEQVFAASSCGQLQGDCARGGPQAPYAEDDWDKENKQQSHEQYKQRRKKYRRRGARRPQARCRELYGFPLHHHRTTVVKSR